jgi:hypothetical protein
MRCPHPDPHPGPHPCCAHGAGSGAGPGTCAFGAAVCTGVVVIWRTFSASAASCAVNVTVVVVIVLIITFSVAAALVKLAMASTVSCWNSVVVAFAMLYPAPMAVFFVRRYVLCALVKWALILFQLFSTRGRPFHFHMRRVIRHC